MELKIYWTDTIIGAEGSKSQTVQLRPAKQITRGMLVSEGEDYITIAATSSPDNNEDSPAYYRDATCVYKRQIDKVVVMKEGEEYLGGSKEGVMMGDKHTRKNSRGLQAKE